MDANERYEYMAAKFMKDTGMMAPGKDDALMSHSQEERMEAWRAWSESFYSDMFDSASFWEDLARDAMSSLRAAASAASALDCYEERLTSFRKQKEKNND